MKKYLTNAAIAGVIAAGLLMTGCAAKGTSADGHYKAEIDVGGSVTVNEVGMVDPDVILPVQLDLKDGEYTAYLDTGSMADDFEDARTDDAHYVANVEAEDEVVYTGHYTVDGTTVTFDGDMHFVCVLEDGVLTADHFLGVDGVVFTK